MKVAVIADPHIDFSVDPLSYEASKERTLGRRTDIADILLLRTIHRLNRYIRPDLVLIVGDLINDPSSPLADTYYEKIKAMLSILKMPYIVIPGNHDVGNDRFYRFFDRPNEGKIDIGGVRFLVFTDPEEPGYNARRTAEDLERMKAAREDGFSGPIVTVQHVPLWPPHLGDWPYNYTNIVEILDVMRSVNIKLAISGHYHRGFRLRVDDGSVFMAAAALCEDPFPFWVVSLNPDSAGADFAEVKVEEIVNKLPNIGLVDAHVHTPFAYCNENMDIRKALVLAEAFGLRGVRFTEHSSHLYFSRQDYSRGRLDKIDTSSEHCRIKRYFEELSSAGVNPEWMGLEVDCDPTGRPVVRDEDKARAGLIIGAVHRLSSLDKLGNRRTNSSGISKDTDRKDRNKDEIGADMSTIREAKEEFVSLHRKFLASGIDILAHPFRVFRRAGLEVPEDLFPIIARLLRENNVAAEINFHTNTPAVEFFKLCIDSGVKLSLGSDAHNLYEVGLLHPHLELLRSCGISDSELGRFLVHK